MYPYNIDQDLTIIQTNEATSIENHKLKIKSGSESRIVKPYLEVFNQANDILDKYHAVEYENKKNIEKFGFEDFKFIEKEKYSTTNDNQPIFKSKNGLLPKEKEIVLYIRNENQKFENFNKKPWVNYFNVSSPPGSKTLRKVYRSSRYQVFSI